MTTVKEVLCSPVGTVGSISKDEFMKYFKSLHDFINAYGFNGNTIVKSCVIEDCPGEDVIEVNLYFMYGPHILSNGTSEPEKVGFDDLNNCTSASNSYVWSFRIRKSTGKAIYKNLNDFTLFNQSPIWSPEKPCPNINKVTAVSFVTTIASVVGKLSIFGKNIHSIEFNYVSDESSIPEDSLPYGYKRGNAFREVYGSKTNDPASGIGAWYLGVDLRTFPLFNSCKYCVSTSPYYVQGCEEVCVKFTIDSLECRGNEAFGVIVR